MTFTYDPTANDNQLTCSVMCSRDIFDKTTVALVSQRFEYLFDQIFGTTFSVSVMDNCMISMKKLSVILPEEAAEIQTRIFCRMESIVKKGM
jgi:hypothetical protein